MHNIWFVYLVRMLVMIKIYLFFFHFWIPIPNSLFSNFKMWKKNKNKELCALPIHGEICASVKHVNGGDGQVFLFIWCDQRLGSLWLVPMYPFHDIRAFTIVLVYHTVNTSSGIKIVKSFESETALVTTNDTLKLILVQYSPRNDVPL